VILKEKKEDGTSSISPKKREKGKGSECHAGKKKVAVERDFPTCSSRVEGKKGREKWASRKKKRPSLLEKGGSDLQWGKKGDRVRGKKPGVALKGGDFCRRQREGGEGVSKKGEGG